LPVPARSISGHASNKRFDGQRERLEASLNGVQGYFSEDEAWALYKAVATLSEGPNPPRVVEIGSYKGRSTIAIGLALERRGSGLCVSIDPHAPTGKESYIAEHGTEDTFGEFLNNVQSAGVSRWIQPIRATSENAKPTYDGAAIDLLFIDGSHDYDDVLLDVQLWMPLVKEGGVVAFNDPYARAVNRVIKETFLTGETSFSAPFHVNNTLFLTVKTKPLGGQSKPSSYGQLKTVQWSVGTFKTGQ
jgi:predicted O-methyltransferase YrrM